MGDEKITSGYAEANIMTVNISTMTAMLMARWATLSKAEAVGCLELSVL